MLKVWRSTYYMIEALSPFNEISESQEFIPLQRTMRVLCVFTFPSVIAMSFLVWYVRFVPFTRPWTSVTLDCCKWSKNLSVFKPCLRKSLPAKENRGRTTFYACPLSYNAQGISHTPPPRLPLANIPLHIIPRSNTRQTFFFSETDYELHLDSLHQYAEKTAYRVHTYGKT